MEVYHNGEWGTVCDDGWDLNDAQVVCSELEIGQAISAVHNAFYGQGSGQIQLSNLNCAGSEWTIENCTHRGWGVSSCTHADDASIQCAAGNLEYLFTLNHNFILCIKSYKKYM